MYKSHKSKDSIFEWGSWHQFGETSKVIFTCPFCGEINSFDAGDVVKEDDIYSIQIKCQDYMCKFNRKVNLEGWRK